MQVIIGIDPGREKCGFAVVALDGKIIEHTVIDTPSLASNILDAAVKYQLQHIVMGNGTTSRTAMQTVQAAVKGKFPLTLVDEYRTTEQARQRYFIANPPTGLKRLIPRGMLYPPVPVDDYVAVILAERYLHYLDSNSG